MCPSVPLTIPAPGLVLNCSFKQEFLPVGLFSWKRTIRELLQSNPSRVPVFHTQFIKHTLPAHSQFLSLLSIFCSFSISRNRKFPFYPELFCKALNRSWMPLSLPDNEHFPRFIPKVSPELCRNSGTQGRDCAGAAPWSSPHSPRGTPGNPLSFRTPFINLIHGNKLKLQLPTQKWRLCREGKDTEKRLSC